MVGDVVKKTFKIIVREQFRKVWAIRIKPEIEKFKNKRGG
jgi:hypothetical protein